MSDQKEIMKSDNGYKIDFSSVGTGIPYINIGTVKCCLFLHMSLFLCSRLEKYPQLYYAIEKGMECSKMGYYAAGVLALSQLLNVLNTSTPKERHKVAHEFLCRRPEKTDYDRVIQQVKDVARSLQRNELKKEKDTKEYLERLVSKWTDLLKSLFPDVDITKILPQNAI